MGLSGSIRAHQKTINYQNIDTNKYEIDYSFCKSYDETNT
jgi:hypothetical protein